MVTKKGFRGNMGKGLIYLIVFLLGMICLLPLLNILALSFSSSDAAAANIVGFVPVKFTTAAYNKILEDRQFWRSFGISVVRVALQLVLNLVLIVLMAYPLSKSAREFRGRNIYMNLLVFAMLFSGGMIPSYLVVKRLGLINTVWSLVLPGAVPIFSVIMVMNFFMGVPKALEEAAILDGATPIQVLTRVYIPCSKPVIATVALFSIVGSWNDFFGGLIYMTRVANYPLQTYIQSLSVSLEDILHSGGSLSTLVNAMEVSKQNLNAAKIVVSVVPLLLIYPVLQKYLITGIVMGSVKE
jgi:putative aldouronate transport system permease protein